MAVGKEYYEQTINKYEANSKKKIGGWITMLSIGSVVFVAGILMLTFGIIYHIIPIIVLGPICTYLIGLPMMIVGVVFLVLFSVKRGVARGKIKRAEKELDNIKKAEDN